MDIWQIHWGAALNEGHNPRLLFRTLPVLLVHIPACPFLSCAFFLRSCIIPIPLNFQISAFLGLGQCNLTLKKGTFWKVSGQEASRSVFQPEVFQVVNSIFRNTRCKPAQFPSVQKPVGNFASVEIEKTVGLFKVAQWKSQECPKPAQKITCGWCPRQGHPESQPLSTCGTPWTQPWHCWHCSPEKPPPVPAALSGCSVNTYKD